MASELAVSESGTPEVTLEAENARFAIVLLLVAEIMFFGALVGMYIVLRFSAENWKPPLFAETALGIPLVNTGVLVLSGFFMLLGSRAVRGEGRLGLVCWLCLTLLCGAVFAAVQYLEFSRLLEEGLALNNIFGTVFYTMAGLHALHVAGGVLLLSYVICRAIGGKYRPGRRIGVDLALYYWLMVVLVWIFFFVILYIL